MRRDKDEYYNKIINIQKASKNDAILTSPKF